MQQVTKRLRWIAVGATLGWLLDPVNGAPRREQLRRLGRDVSELVSPSVAWGSTHLPEPLRSRVQRVAARQSAHIDLPRHDTMDAMAARRVATD